MSVSLPNVDSLTSDKPLATSASTLNGAGILVVDEDPAFQLGLKTFLKEYVGFHEVFTARNGAEALQLLEKEKSIEIVTLDYQMPGMNGIEMLRRLNAEPPHPLSVLMITGYPSDELEDEFRKLGTAKIHTTHFLSKPVEFEDLESIIVSSHNEMKAAERLAAALVEEEERKAAEAKQEAKANAAQTESRLAPPNGFASGRLHDPTGPISPIAAAAIFAQRDPTEPIPFIETSNPEMSRKFDELSDTVSRLESEVTQMNHRTPSVQGRFLLDILKIIFIAAVAFVLFQFDVFQKVSSFLQSKSAPAPVVETAPEPETPVFTETIDVAPPLVETDIPETVLPEPAVSPPTELEPEPEPEPSVPDIPGEPAPAVPPIPDV